MRANAEASAAEPVFAPTAAVVSCVRGEALLLVPVREGTARLSEACALRGSARRLFEDARATTSLAEAARFLVAEGASVEQAARDAAQTLASLRARGLVPTDGAPAVASSAAEGEAVLSVEAEDLADLARSVLAQGHGLRFQARGRSMRPLLPHGSTLEVVARSFDEVSRGEVVLFTTEEQRLVAHRVIERGADELVTRGDSSPRLDRVSRSDYLGTVKSSVRPGGGLAAPVSAGMRRWLGLACGTVYAWVSSAARLLVIRPLRNTYDKPSLVRAGLRAILRLLGGGLGWIERIARRLRRPLDRARAALMSTEEKDEERRELYKKRTVQSFTSLDENVHCGLTLLEEVMLSRHSLEPGRALVLGSGPGRECFSLAERGFEVTGIDREPGMLEEARRLAAERSLDARFLIGEVDDFDVEGAPFDLVVVFSGLYNMLLPRARRVALLSCAFRHLRPGGRVALTFLSDYVLPGLPAPPRTRTFLEALSPDHELGDQFFLNETVHIFPRARDLEEEALEAGFEVEAVHRDQRAYDRSEGRVKGYAFLRRPLG